MPKYIEDKQNNAEADGGFKSQRRAAQQARQRRNTTRPATPVRRTRQIERRISVRAELRDQPDVRKIARAVISMALAEAERESAAREPASTNDDQQHRAPESAGE